MKKLIFILTAFCSVAVSAQDMIRLTKAQADKIGYLKIKEWYAIQPIELKDGTFILPVSVKADIEKFLAEPKKDIISKPVVDATLVDLKKYPVRKLDPTELKEEEEIKEKEIIRK